MPLKTFCSLGLAVALVGCVSNWIANPSPATRAVVEDMKLEGFECTAGFSTIVCMQIEPLRNKRPSLCSSDKGCIKQPDHLVYNRYSITQLPSGLPAIVHDLVTQVDD